MTAAVMPPYDEGAVRLCKFCPTQMTKATTNVVA